MNHLDEELYSHIFVDAIEGQDLVKPETLVITSDVSNPVIFECAEIVENANTFVVIDHHRQSKEFDKKPDISYIEPTASSASELVCEILEHVMPPESSLREEADLLYAGMLLDTQAFSRNTGVRTFGAAIFLDNAGGSLERGREMLKADASEYKKLASIQAGVTVYRGVYAITIYENDGDENNRVIAAKAADSLLGIEGVKATFVLTAVENGVHISARSDGSINVALILETIGGGGHFNMAGALLEDVSMENAVLELKEAIEKFEKK
jgi:c-di-AMP phosphodiesterase-like protein